MGLAHPRSPAPVRAALRSQLLTWLQAAVAAARAGLRVGAGRAHVDDSQADCQVLKPDGTLPATIDATDAARRMNELHALRCRGA